MADHSSTINNNSNNDGNNNDNNPKADTVEDYIEISHDLENNTSATESSESDLAPESGHPINNANVVSQEPATNSITSSSLTSATTVTSMPAMTTTTSAAATKKPVTRPSWATGDPFFDTMAGMESSECRKYYIDNEDSQKQSLEDQLTSVSITNQASNGEGSSSSTTTDTSIGLDHWNKTREQWTKGRWHVVPSPNSNNPALSAIHPKNHDAIYDSLVYDRKRLSKPIPLPLVIKVLVSGWKRDGVWLESPAPSLSGSTPTSTTTTQGISGYVPGFSSTNSQPVARKL